MKKKAESTPQMEWGIPWNAEVGGKKKSHFQILIYKDRKHPVSEMNGNRKLEIRKR